MNRKLILIAVISFCIVSAGYSQEHHASYSVSTNNGHSSISITDDKLNFSFSYSTGDISFTDDEKGFKSFPNDGFLRYQKDGKRLIVTTDASGKIAYEINGGDKKTTLSEDEKELVANVIKVMIDYGVGAKDRVSRLYKNGGTKAVMDEVKNMKTDYVKSIYLQFLLSTNSLSAADMTEIANNVQSMISSDYEKGKLLEAFSSKYLGNAATAKAFLEAVKSIHSDYEKAKAVKGILHQELSDEQFTNVIDITNTINSDYEKAGVLKEVIENNKISASRFTEVLHASTKISSDYEKAGVLKKVFETGVRVPENAFAETLDAAGSIGSDYEKAGVLKKLAESEIKSDENWITLINATAKLGGDYEKGETLRFIATKMPGSEAVKDAYMKSAKTIGADYEYGKTIRALK
ncbi:MAG TPA: hypothetical protein VKT28_04750 [Puia sp.]|nr:hypothetical protein [Puia sp.]